MPVLRCGPSNKRAHSAPSPNVDGGPAVFWGRLLTELPEATTRQLFAAPRIERGSRAHFPTDCSRTRVVEQSIARRVVFDRGSRRTHPRGGHHERQHEAG